jgi:hypothetical protein
MSNELTTAVLVISSANRLGDGAKQLASGPVRSDLSPAADAVGRAPRVWRSRGAAAAAANTVQPQLGPEPLPEGEVRAEVDTNVQHVEVDHLHAVQLFWRLRECRSDHVVDAGTCLR